MNILLFKQDLDNYPNKDIFKLAKMYGIQAPVYDLRWLIAIQNAKKYANMFTDDQNINEQIIEKMDDTSLLNYCNTSKIKHKECEPIWKRRVENLGYNGKLAPMKDWQQIYIVLSKYKKLLLNTNEYIQLRNLDSRDREQEDIYNYYDKMSESLITDMIKLNATNIIEWLINISIVDATYGIYDFYKIVTKYCKPDILEMFYNHIVQNLSIKKTIDPHFRTELDELYINILDKNKCPNLVKVIKFWYNTYGISPGYKVADNALKNSRHDVLDYLAKLGVLPISSTPNFLSTIMKNTIKLFNV